MSPSHARKGNVKYRYYLSAALLQAAAARAGSVRRVPASKIEALVVKSVRDNLKPSQAIDDRSLVHTHVTTPVGGSGVTVIEPPCHCAVRSMR
jgi:hypothetical protein